MKIMILGAGGQGAPCASILSGDPDIDEIKLCDFDVDLLQKVQQKINSTKLKAEVVDASVKEEIVAIAKGMDAVIDPAPPVFFTNVWN